LSPAFPNAQARCGGSDFHGALLCVDCRQPITDN
jgi:hypothetical protein